MTDNNADETAANSKLSRRTALTLMGTSAVGGAAATSAFSQLTADRPIDVEVVNSGDAETADSGSSQLQITNNSSSTIDARIETTDSSVYLEGSNSATVASGSNPWTAKEISGGGTTATLDFEYASSTDTSVDFDVTAFTGTDGFSIGTQQTVSVTGGQPSSGLDRWMFEDDSDTSTAIDVWGGEDASIGAGGSYSSSSATGDRSISLDGTNEFLSVSGGSSATFNVSDPVSVSFWVNLDNDLSGGSTDNQSFVYKNGSFSIENGSNDGSSIAMGIWGDRLESSKTSWSSGTWYHIVSVVDAGNDVFKLYVDGSENASKTPSTTLDTNTNDLGIGQRPDDGSRKADGQIDDVRIYDKALSSTEVSNLYNNGSI